MFDFLFDPPWYLIVALLLAGAWLLYNGLSKGVRSVQTAGFAAVALAIVIYVAGLLVETGRERVVRLTGELATAVDKRDWPAFKSLLDPQVRFAVFAGRDQLTLGAQKTVEAVNVHNIGIGGYEVKPEPGGYQVSFTASADVESGYRAPTDWRFYWSKADGKPGYLLYKIEPLGSGQMGPELITSRLARP